VRDNQAIDLLTTSGAEKARTEQWCNLGESWSPILIFYPWFTVLESSISPTLDYRRASSAPEDRRGADWRSRQYKTAHGSASTTRHVHFLGYPPTSGSACHRFLVPLSSFSVLPTVWPNVSLLFVIVERQVLSTILVATSGRYRHHFLRHLRRLSRNTKCSSWFTICHNRSGWTTSPKCY
jgi:hypothetical protein